MTDTSVRSGMVDSRRAIWSGATRLCFRQSRAAAASWAAGSGPSQRSPAWQACISVRVMTKPSP